MHMFHLHGLPSGEYWLRQKCVKIYIFVNFMLHVVFGGNVTVRHKHRPLEIWYDGLDEHQL